MKEKREKITISFVGTNKFKKYVINRIVELIQSEDFAESVAKPGCDITLESTIDPSEED